MRLHAPCALLLVFVFTGSSTASEEKSKNALGQEWDVRVNARIVADSPSSPVIRVAWDVENLGDRGIEIANVAPVASWDPESRIVTVNVGAELPITDETRFVRIAPKETKSFSVSTPLGMGGIKRGRVVSSGRLVRVKVHFLATGGEEQNRTADFFDTWIEQKRSVVTNAIPVNTFTSYRPMQEEPSRRRSSRRP